MRRARRTCARSIRRHNETHEERHRVGQRFEMTEKITFELDGRTVEADEGETIWQVAERHGTTIPHLCWLPEPGYRADGNCRACMVETEEIGRGSCRDRANDW